MEKIVTEITQVEERPTKGRKRGRRQWTESNVIGTASPKEKQVVGRFEETEDKQNTLMETEQTNLEKTKKKKPGEWGRGHIHF